MIVAAALALGLGAAPSQAAVCTAADNGGGTVDLPVQPSDPACGLETRTGPLQITNGLPIGTTIDIEIVSLSLVCVSPIEVSCSVPISPPLSCEAAGGVLGGDADCAYAGLQLDVVGTGSIAGYNRTLGLQPEQEIHTAPRTPGDPAQVMDAELFRLEGQIFGDPDFCTFTLRAGTIFGLPSPGQVRLLDNGDSTFNVDSFFDVAYEIDFVGCPGSPLEGFGGTTQGSVRLDSGQGPPATPQTTPASVAVLAGMLAGAGALLAVRARRRAA